MNKPEVSNLFKSVKLAVVKRSPEILTGVGIAGMITTTILAVKATTKAIELIEVEKRRQNKKIVEEAKKNGQTSCKQVTKLEPVEIIKVCWRVYIPTVITGVSSIACLVGASSVNARQNAALATAYNLSRTALTEYREKVVETLGKDQDESIRKSIDNDHIERKPVTKSEVIVTDNGDTLCYDSISGRYFKSSIDQIKKAENSINRTVITEMYVALNEFYDELDLDHTKLGNDLGWNIDDGLIEIDFSSQIADNGKPCVVVNYSVAPRYGYSKLF